MKNRHEFAEYLKENNCKVGIEIGSYRGLYAKYLMENWNGHLYMVDTWKQMDYSEYADASNQINAKEIISDVFDNLNGYEERTTLIRANANFAVNLFPDEFFDFVYIDANHKYQYVINDMKLWYPKLKKGGIFSGHDFIADYKEEWANEDGDIHVWMLLGKTNEDGTPKSEYAGLFGVNKAVKDFCDEFSIQFETTTDEYFKTWYFKKWENI